MKVKNPTNEEITVQIKGLTYIVKAEGELSNVPAEHAEYWKNNLHNFIIIEKENSKVTSKVKEVIEEVIEEVKEEVKEEDSKLKKLIKKIK